MARPIDSEVANKLAEARALVERGWTQGGYARGKSGRLVDEKGKAAASFCSLGAVYRVDGGCDMLETLRRAVGARYIGAIAAWNDDPERTQAEVLAAFDKAIELARGAGMTRPDILDRASSDLHWPSIVLGVLVFGLGLVAVFL